VLYSNNLKGDVIFVTLKQAVENKLIDNETLAYFMGRTYQFLI
jgi:glycyl-tRNA synthetase (class II)